MSSIINIVIMVIIVILVTSIILVWCFRWQELLDLLKIHKDKLERSNAVINLEREIDTLTLTIQLLQVYNTTWFISINTIILPSPKVLCSYWWAASVLNILISFYTFKRLLKKWEICHLSKLFFGKYLWSN